MLHLRAPGSSFVLDARGTGVPVIVHWGADLGDLNASDLVAVADATIPGVPPSSIDSPLRLSILPLLAEGWPGRPGLEGGRGGQSVSLAFRLALIDVIDEDAVVVGLRDDEAELDVSIEFRFTSSGLLRSVITVTNTGSEPWRLDRAVVTLPLHAQARELLDFGGRWAAERRPQTRSIEQGTWLRETRHGRTGHDSPFVTVAGSPGFGFRSGEVWAMHVGWSGDVEVAVESNATGHSLISGGERLDTGEVVLAPGETYVSPAVFAAWSDRGLDGVSERFHEWVRSRTERTGRAADAIRAPRVVLNTWEAVYFRHDEQRLLELADIAASVGVERFVLDDGWMAGRTDDRRALGDWTVDRERWPDGLHTLVERVVGHGMEFGLWIEPEMVSLDSELARAHPDWVLRDSAGRLPQPWRHQFAVDLGNADAYANVRDQLVALLDEYPISYLKWDQNRDLLGGSSHRQTTATYRLMDELRDLYPSLEIESCSSGGGRVDLGVLERTDRVWGSDTNDPLARQRIQRWTTLLVPPEIVGSHVGAPVSHTTDRAASLPMRLATASFASAGIEWDIATTSEAERETLRDWIAWFKSIRTQIASGRTVRADPTAEGLFVHGVVADDGSTGHFQVVCEDALGTAMPPLVRFPGLDDAANYEVEPIRDFSSTHFVQAQRPRVSAEAFTLPGRALTLTGFAVPVLNPGQILLYKVVRTSLA